MVQPDGITWRYASDARLYVVLLYPLLLQVAHPTVGAGVRDFSDFEQRPWERLLRSLDWASLLVYGGPEAAAAGRRLRALHSRFKGTREDGRPYHALEPEAYAWVHATLLEAYVAGHARFGRPMSRSDTERFYREYRRLGELAGVRAKDLPADWSGFRAYFERTVREQLVPTDAVQRVVRAFANPSPPPVPQPGLAWRIISVPLQRSMWLGGIGLTPPVLRSRLGIDWTRRDELAFRALGVISRGLTPVMPEHLQIMGPGHLRLRREAIARGPLGHDPVRAALSDDRAA